jgi:outer membrane protein
MKQASLILNLILLAAVSFLYYKVYNTTAPSSALPAKASNNSTGIFYVDADTLFERYNFYKATKASLEKREDSIKTLLEKRSEALQNEAAQYQEKAQGMTDAQRQQTESALMAKQQTLVALKDNLLAKLQTEQNALNDSVNNHMQQKIKAFVKGKNIAYIVGYHRTGEVLYANDSLNITNEVVLDLNK